VLNTQENVDILKDFIEAILDMKITEIELNPYLYKKELYLPSEENFGIADVRVKTSKNEEINVGIQFIDGIYVQTKMLMYYSQIHLNQLEYDDRREFARTVTINILDFIYFNSLKFDKTIKIGTNEGDINLEEIELQIIELPKFSCKNNYELTRKEEWISYFKGCERKILENIKNQNKYIKKLDELLQKYWETEKME
jgi:predicted transposase/invertase (TIGR01784 family)